MKSLARYAYLNALVRAKLSRCLAAEQFRSLVGAPDLAEEAALLRGTDYESLCPLIERRERITLIEKALLKAEIGFHRELLARAKGAVRDLIFSVTEVYDVEKVEGVIRLWREKEWEEKDSLIEEVICYPIPVEEMLRAESIEEIILLLDVTPYRRALMAGYADYRRTQRLFYLESALEADYYSRLAERVETLWKGDRSIAARLIGLEIDLRNIEILLRARRYSDLTAGELRGMLLPGGSAAIEKALVDAYASKEMRPVLRGLRGIPIPAGLLGAGASESTEGLALIRSLLEETVQAEARRALGAYPFTIGTVIAYLSLKRSEARRLRRVLVGKALGIRADRLASGPGAP